MKRQVLALHLFAGFASIYVARRAFAYASSEILYKLHLSKSDLGTRIALAVLLYGLTAAQGPSIHSLLSVMPSANLELVSQIFNSTVTVRYAPRMAISYTLLLCVFIFLQNENIH